MDPDKARELFSILKTSRCWEWMAGMQTTDGWRLIWVDYPDVAYAHKDNIFPNNPYNLLTAVLDFSDPATVGCLLAIAREAWGCGPDRRLYIAPAGKGWVPRVEQIHCTGSGTVAGWVADAEAIRLFGDKSYPTEVEAIIEAILDHGCAAQVAEWHETE